MTRDYFSHGTNVRCHCFSDLEPDKCTREMLRTERFDEVYRVYTLLSLMTETPSKIDKPKLR